MPACAQRTPSGGCGQQVTVSSVATAHECSSPRAKALKVPAGALVWPLVLLPQHVMVPSVAIAQLWAAPADTV